MTRVGVDFSDIEEFSPIEKGTYPAVVAKAEMRLAEETGKEYNYINWEFDLTEGEFKGRKQWMVTSFSPKALWRMKEMFENIGIYQDELEIDYDEETKLITDPEVSGLPCVLEVSKKLYEGRQTNQVDAVLAPEGGPAKKTTSRAKKAPAGAKKTGTSRSRSFK